MGTGLESCQVCKTFPLQFISNFTVNHQAELATQGKKKRGKRSDEGKEKETGLAESNATK